MLSHWVRKLMTAMLLALLVGWWMPKIINPPRMLPIPIKDFIDAYAPPHLDPGAKNRKNMHMIKPITDKKLPNQDNKESKWAVQIGSYRALTSIQPTINELKNQGYTVVVHPVELDGKMLYRIWVGELNSRNAAKSLSAELKSRFKLQGFVLRLGES